jgi:hypothetical protein
MLLCYPLNIGSGRAKVQFAVGFKFQGKTGHVVVDADDALIAALKVKIQRPETLITYVRQQNKRGDTRHPYAPSQQREPLECRLLHRMSPHGRKLACLDHNQRSAHEG